MALIPKPKFPNVPSLPGVPQLLRSPLFPPSPSPVLGAAAAIGALWRSLFAPPVWGIFDQPKYVPNENSRIETDAEGNRSLVVEIGSTPPARRVVDADSVLDFGYRNEVDIPDFPIQDGSFAAYNRVNLPYEASVRLSKGGSEEARRAFLNQIDSLMNTIDLFQIITPERTYKNVSPVRFEMIRRGRGGAAFLTEVDLYFREIRSVTPQYTQTSVTTENAKDPSAQPVTNQGTVNGERPVQAPQMDGVVTQ